MIYNVRYLKMRIQKDKILEYYARRAPEYERIYHRSARQEDLRKIERMIGEIFQDLDVLEVACGTGYWTQFAAKGARSILATDYNSEVLEIAQTKDYGKCKVNFVKADAYSLNEVTRLYSAGLVCLWWSHIAKTDLPLFLNAFHSKLEYRSPVVVLDTQNVEGYAGPIFRTDEEGNTYQVRELPDGSLYEVLKNFPNELEFKKFLSGYASDIEFVQHPYFWLAQYNVLKTPSKVI